MSVSGTTPSKAGIAQPVLINGSGGLSSESNGVKGGAQFREQQSELKQSNSVTQSSQSIHRQESSYSSYTESSHEYSHRTRITLADCQLELKLSILTIKPKSSGVDFTVTTVDLDEHVGNINGVLTWGYKRFNVTCEKAKTRVEGTFLVASCDRGNGQYIESKLDLNEYITYITSRRCFEAIVTSPAFTELISSATWMNIAVIAQPDLRVFLTHPAFQETIRGVAQRAVEEVIDEMNQEISLAVKKAVSQVSIRAKEHVEYEIKSLVTRATLINTAAYAGLAGLTVMSDEQRREYGTFAPFIGLGKGCEHGNPPPVNKPTVPALPYGGYCPVPLDTPVRFLAVHAGTAVDWDGNHSKVTHMWQSYLGPNQGWRIIRSKDGFYIKHIEQNKYLQCQNASANNDRIYIGTGDVGSTFLFEQMPDGTTMVHLADRLEYTLNVEGGSKANTTKLIMWLGTKSNNDRWRIRDYSQV